VWIQQASCQGLVLVILLLPVGSTLVLGYYVYDSSLKKTK